MKFQNYKVPQHRLDHHFTNPVPSNSKLCAHCRPCPPPAFVYSHELLACNSKKSCGKPI